MQRSHPVPELGMKCHETALPIFLLYSAPTSFGASKTQSQKSGLPTETFTQLFVSGLAFSQWASNAHLTATYCGALKKTLELVKTLPADQRQNYLKKWCTTTTRKIFVFETLEEQTWVVLHNLLVCHLHLLAQAASKDSVFDGARAHLAEIASIREQFETLFTQNSDSPALRACVRLLGLPDFVYFECVPLYAHFRAASLTALAAPDVVAKNTYILNEFCNKRWRGFLNSGQNTYAAYLTINMVSYLQDLSACLCLLQVVTIGERHLEVLKAAATQSSNSVTLANSVNHVTVCYRALDAWIKTRVQTRAVFQRSLEPETVQAALKDFARSMTSVFPFQNFDTKSAESQTSSNLQELYGDLLLPKWLFALPSAANSQFAPITSDAKSGDTRTKYETFVAFSPWILDNFRPDKNWITTICARVKKFMDNVPAQGVALDIIRAEPTSEQEQLKKELIASITVKP